MSTLPASQALPLISQYESGNQNVLTNIQPASGPPNTASGYYQITNPTWQQYAPQAGVNLSQYPTAMSAPEGVQTQVASTIYAARGLQPWSSNTNLMNAVGDASVSGTTLPMLDQNGNPIQATDPITAASGLGVAGQTAGSATVAAASSLLDPLWEILSRGFLAFAGLALCLIAIAALLWQSKTVRVSARALAG